MWGLVKGIVYGWGVGGEGWGGERGGEGRGALGAVLVAQLRSPRPRQRPGSG